MQKKKKIDKGDPMNLSAELYRTIVEIVDDKMKSVKTARDDISSLAVITKELAEAQSRTEARLERLAAKVEELAEAQKRTDVKLEQLAEAQKSTETKLGHLIETVEKHSIKIDALGKQVGGMSNSMGYALENEAYRALPAVLKEKFGIEMKEKLIRQNVKFSDGTGGELNIVGRGLLPGGAEILVFGEAKTRAAHKDFDLLLEKSRKLSADLPVKHFLVMVTHFCDPDIPEYARRLDVNLVYTYEFHP